MWMFDHAHTSHPRFRGIGRLLFYHSNLKAIFDAMRDVSDFVVLGLALLKPLALVEVHLGIPSGRLGVQDE